MGHMGRVSSVPVHGRVTELTGLGCGEGGALLVGQGGFGEINTGGTVVQGEGYAVVRALVLPCSFERVQGFVCVHWLDLQWGVGVVGGGLVGVGSHLGRVGEGVGYAHEAVSVGLGHDFRVGVGCDWVSVALGRLWADIGVCGGGGGRGCWEDLSHFSGFTVLSLAFPWHGGGRVVWLGV